MVNNLPYLLDNGTQNDLNALIGPIVTDTVQLTKLLTAVAAHNNNTIPRIESQTFEARLRVLLGRDVESKAA